ncbi:thiosulfate sulfurtransferase, partial [Acinetobacter baumannii]|nr:thiosulfate sulfurtransferase [Acinetobacter baumannii]
GKEFKVFEVSWGEEKDSPDYLKGHIPGAVHINTDELEEGPLWNRLSDDKLIEFAKANGVTTDTTVVLYGGDTCAASRAAVMFKYLGVKDVRLLNGGTSKWTNAGYEVETKSNPKVAVESFGADAPLKKGYIVDYDKALTAVDKPEENTLVDIRSWEEYIGKTSGYSYIKPTGRPVCSLWGHGGSDSASMEDFRNEDNTMVSGDQILKMWKEYGITTDKNLMFFCGTGWRAAEVLWYADVMGIENISLYDGGWNEW